MLRDAIDAEGLEEACEEPDAQAEAEEDAAEPLPQAEEGRPPKHPRLGAESPLPAPSSRPSRAHRRRKRKREDDYRKRGHVARKETVQAHICPSASLQTPLTTEALPAASGGYSAKNVAPRAAKKQHRLDDLLAQGFSLVSWDGR